MTASFVCFEISRQNVEPTYCAGVVFRSRDFTQEGEPTLCAGVVFWLRDFKEKVEPTLCAGVVFWARDFKQRGEPHFVLACLSSPWDVTQVPLCPKRQPRNVIKGYSKCERVGEKDVGMLAIPQVSVCLNGDLGSWPKDPKANKLAKKTLACWTSGKSQQSLNGDLGMWSKCGGGRSAGCNA